MTTRLAAAIGLLLASCADPIPTFKGHVVDSPYVASVTAGAAPEAVDTAGMPAPMSDSVDEPSEPSIAGVAGTSGAAGSAGILDMPSAGSSAASVAGASGIGGSGVGGSSASVAGMGGSGGSGGMGGSDTAATDRGFCRITDGSWKGNIVGCTWMKAIHDDGGLTWSSHVGSAYTSHTCVSPVPCAVGAACSLSRSIGYGVIESSHGVCQ